MTVECVKKQFLLFQMQLYQERWTVQPKLLWLTNAKSRCRFIRYQFQWPWTTLMHSKTHQCTYIHHISGARFASNLAHNRHFAHVDYVHLYRWLHVLPGTLCWRQKHVAFVCDCAVLTLALMSMICHLTSSGLTLNTLMANGNNSLAAVFYYLNKLLTILWLFCDQRSAELMALLGESC